MNSIRGGRLLASGREYFAAMVWIAEDFFPFTRMHALATSGRSHLTCRSPDVDEERGREDAESGGALGAQHSSRWIVVGKKAVPHAAPAG